MLENWVPHAVISLVKNLCIENGEVYLKKQKLWFATLNTNFIYDGNIFKKSKTHDRVKTLMFRDPHLRCDKNVLNKRAQELFYEINIDCEITSTTYFILEFVLKNNTPSEKFSRNINF